MNLYRTTIFFALLLSMLWVFGLMTAYKRLVPDESRIVPTLESADAKVDTVIIKKKQGKETEEVHLTKEKDAWYHKSGEQKVKLEGFKVDGLVNEAKRATKSEAFAGSEDLAKYGLAPPQTTVTLKGTLKGQPKEWQLHFGNESPDKLLVYASSSDRPDRAYGVARNSVEALFKDPSTLRPRRLFDFTEASANRIDIKKGDKEIELKRGDDATWRFEKPALGFAGFDITSPTAVGGDPAKKEGGVKGLLGAITGLHVDDDDFIAPGQPLSRFGLEEGKEAMRIEVGTAGSGDKKEGTREALLIGTKAAGDQYYARVLGDDGVVQIDAKQLAEIEKALNRPGEIRSRDVAAFDVKNADVVVLKQGDDEVKLVRGDGDDWKLQTGTAKHRANSKGATALVEALQGKNAIQKFDDPAESEQKKYDETWGLDKPAVTAAIYTDGRDKENKEELKKDAKPAVTLALGKTADGSVHVKRTLPDGTVSRFTMNKTVLDTVQPEQGLVLALLDPDLPAPSLFEVVELTLRQGKMKQELVRQDGRWQVKDAQEPSGFRPADTARVDALLEAVDKLQAKKWVEKLGAKSDLESYGLKAPELELTLVARRERMTPAGAASMLGQVWSHPLAGAATALAPRRETTTIVFGKEHAKTHDFFARHTGSEVVFLAGADVVKLVRETDLRDRTIVLNMQPALVAGAVAGVEWLTAVPLVVPEAVDLQPASVTQIKIAIRKPEELRTLAFKRVDKKTWQDDSGLQEFQLSSERVEQLVEKLAHLQAERLVALAGGPRAEQKLTPTDASLRIELTTASGRKVTLLVGAEVERAGYYAHSSAWPEVVFLVASDTVEPLLRGGVGYFSKERVAAR